MVKGPLIKDAMNNTPQVKTFTVGIAVTLRPLGVDSLEFIPKGIDWSIPANMGITVVDETEKFFCADCSSNDVQFDWCVAFETRMPIADAVDEIRRTLLIDWCGNGCNGEHWECVGVDVDLNFDSIA